MRTIRSIGEVGLIAREAKRLGRSPSVLVGIGDDTAVLRLPAALSAVQNAGQAGAQRQAGPPGGRQLLLFASDMLVEGVHFDTHRLAPERIGWKALAVNVSDVAAMGGRPLWAVVSLGLPPQTPVRFVDGLYRGLARCGRRFGVSIVGGDTDRAPRVIVDVAIIGAVRPQDLTRRRGIRVGDRLYVTGRLGGSYRSGRHATFIPRLAEAQALVRRVRVRAMIDLSDGLASDLWQLSRASRMVLRVEASRIPVARSAGSCLRRACRCRLWRGRQAVYHALTDGEDFELLFAVGPAAAARVPRRLGHAPVTAIGAAVRRGIGVELVEPGGRVRPLTARGFQHF